MRTREQSLNQANRVYDTPIVVEEKRVQQDANGIQREAWAEKYKLLAAAKNQYGTEYEVARQRDNRKTAKFIVPYGPAIDETMRIRFQGKIYDIDNIDNISYKNAELEIRAIERVRAK